MGKMSVNFQTKCFRIHWHCAVMWVGLIHGISSSSSILLLLHHHQCVWFMAPNFFFYCLVGKDPCECLTCMTFLDCGPLEWLVVEIFYFIIFIVV